MNTILPDFVYFDETINSAITLIELLKVNVTRFTIRNALYSNPNFPNISLSDLVTVLNEWHIQGLGCKLDSATLQQVPLPIIAYLKEDNIATFVVVTFVTSDKVKYIHPSLGHCCESVSLFEAKWSGVVLVPDFDNTAGEEFFKKNKQAEQKAKRDYKKSLHIIDDFLTNAESEYIIETSQKNDLFNRSKLGKEGKEISMHRTSYSAYIESRNDPVFCHIYQKASELIKKDLSYFESLQCVRYHPKQEFKYHFDSNKDIRRTHTFLIYLNETFEGGETSFPELGIRITPKTGRCVVFQNMDEYENIIPYSAHAGLPVKTGVKYACNLWVNNSPFQ
ncbi:2OG-Fe(II) oxygenase [Xanthocytophaga agilis]|uniref:2OG-Fe(II) oxygenase n=1 Tax=Xanthocytophaga agilis TaxID=3048010 RepID=A0AAE3UI60_9BACT|nr:2OG-Fe(II) oxygenase [Xanthocytophaga agilis]MDJ1503298.1 2OG-Fe(II) oxygenase [Xanthocytophaga agilis]